MTIRNYGPAACREGHRSRQGLALAVTLMTTLALTAGCRDKHGRVQVEGIVTYGGEQIMNGDIRFYPEVAGGTACGAPIVDGRYVADNKGGLVVGTHRAVIRAFILEKTGPVSGGAADMDLLSGPSQRRGRKPALPLYRVEGRDQFLPPKYNAATELFVEVTGDEDPQTIDFNLERVK